MSSTAYTGRAKRSVSVHADRYGCCFYVFLSSFCLLPAWSTSVIVLKCWGEGASKRRRSVGLSSCSSSLLRLQAEKRKQNAISTTTQFVPTKIRLCLPLTLYVFFSYIQTCRSSCLRRRFTATSGQDLFRSAHHHEGFRISRLSVRLSNIATFRSHQYSCSIRDADVSYLFPAARSSLLATSCLPTLEDPVCWRFISLNLLLSVLFPVCGFFSLFSQLRFCGRSAVSFAQRSASLGFELLCRAPAFVLFIYLLFLSEIVCCWTPPRNGRRRCGTLRILCRFVLSSVP
jgi:hypothetical protein